MRYTEVIYCFISRISQIRSPFRSRLNSVESVSSVISLWSRNVCFSHAYIYVFYFPKKSFIPSYHALFFLIFIGNQCECLRLQCFTPDCRQLPLPIERLIFCLKTKMMLNHRRFTATAGVKGRWGVWRLEKPNPSHLNPLNFSRFDTLCECVNTFWGYFLRIYARTYIRNISFIASSAASRICILLHIFPLFPPIHPSVHRLAV